MPRYSHTFGVATQKCVPLFFVGASPSLRVDSSVRRFSRHSAAGAQKDFYDLLEVQRGVGEDEIKKAYKKLVLKHHPDKGGDVEHFKEITRAYEVLSDKQKRERYDRFGEAGVDNDGPGMSEEDIFSQFFGGRRGRPQRQQTPDKTHVMKVTLEQLYAGQTLRVGWARQVIDKEIGSQMCRACGGRGVVLQTVRMGPIIQQVQGHCGECGGQGQFVKMKGQRELLELNIEQGSFDGQEIRFEAMADEHPAAITGDAVIRLRQETHKEFKRRGADLFIERDISLVEALCGFEVEVTHLDGQRLLIKTAPGEVVQPLPRGLDPLGAGDGKMEWEAMEGFDCPSLTTLAQTEVTDVETLKEAVVTQLKAKGIDVGAFVVDGQRAYFKAGSRQQVLAARTQSPNCTMYVVADAIGSRLMKAVEGAGMPVYNNPSVRGNLFLILNIVFPEGLTAEQQHKLRDVLPPPLNVPTSAHDEVRTTTDMDPIESYNAHKESVRR